MNSDGIPDTGSTYYGKAGKNFAIGRRKRPLVVTGGLASPRSFTVGGSVLSSSLSANNIDDSPELSASAAAAGAATSAAAAEGGRPTTATTLPSEGGHQRQQQQPNMDSNIEGESDGGRRRRRRPEQYGGTTPEAAAAGRAAAARGAVEQQEEPQEDEDVWVTAGGGGGGGGRGGGAFSGASLWADSDLEWRGAPRAGSEALYELNMQLAAYAKDAQWEKAITLLRQARALWRDRGLRAGEAAEAGAGEGRSTALEKEDGGEGEEQEGRGEEGGGGGRGHGRNAAAGRLDDPSASPPSASEEWTLAVPAAEPNVVSYNNVITACANAKKQKRAEGIFREMTKERGIRPNVFTYGALISACAKRGNWEDSVNYLEVRREMRHTLGLLGYAGNVFYR